MAKKALSVLFLFLPILFIYRNWFMLPFLSAPDFPYFFTETIADYQFVPPVWVPTLGIGLGGEMINQGLGTFIYFIVSLFVNTLGIPWEAVYKVFIFGLFLLFSVFSSAYLLGTVIEKPTKIQYFLSALLFTANTYILMVVDGGQVGVMLAYSLAPLVLARFIRLVESLDLPGPISNFQFLIFNSLAAGLVAATQIMFDLRVAFLTVAIGLAYGLYHYLFITRYAVAFYLCGLLLLAVVVIGLHTYWLLPIIVFRSHPAQEMVRTFNFGSLESFRFFSFATFSQTLSLLHPNWPENIFGKVYFMRPEFFVLPILAFVPLLFMRQKTRNNKQSSLSTSLVSYTPFFALLGLFGAFLAKGANPPFSEMNIWVFTHAPFSSLFRDPTKFYVLTVLSYSVLIPIGVQTLAIWARSRLKWNHAEAVLLFIPVVFFVFLLRPVFRNELNGTFSRHQIPKEYIDLKDFLHSQPEFFRTLWVPKQQRYNYYSYLHPAVSAYRLFSAASLAEVIDALQSDTTAETLSNLSIRYLVVPYDSFGEIFIDDRKYDEKQYNDVVSALDAMPWLKRLSGFGKIVVYEAPIAKDHFWLDGEGSLTYTQISPSTYKVTVSSVVRSQMVFAEAYSPYWIAKTGSELVQSKKTSYNLNSFPVTGGGTYEFTVNFSKQTYYKYGRLVTFAIILLLLFMSLYRIIKRRYEKIH